MPDRPFPANVYVMFCPSLISIPLRIICGLYPFGYFPTLTNEQLILCVRKWVDTVVVGLNLCPFAKRELLQDRVRFAVSEASTNAELLRDLEKECATLTANSSVETTLLIHPYALLEFREYNDFLGVVDDRLVSLHLDGVYQIASFHPDYQFEGTLANDVENFTNRSPWPMLHILRERSVERAIANFPDASQIPARNIAQLKLLGRQNLAALLQACSDDVTGRTDQGAESLKRRSTDIP